MSTSATKDKLSGQPVEETVSQVTEIHHWNPDTFMDQAHKHKNRSCNQDVDSKQHGNAERRGYGGTIALHSTIPKLQTGRSEV